METQQDEGFEEVRTAQIELVRLFGRIERMAEKIDQAFGGEPFLPDLAPDDPANIHRFDAFFRQHSRVSKLLFRTVEVWMITCGIRSQDDWIPLLIEDVKQRTEREEAKQDVQQ